MSKEIIAFNVEEARKSEARIRAELDTLDEIMKKFEDVIDDVPTWWVGASREPFIRLAKGYIKQKPKIATVIKNLADNMEIAINRKIEQEKEDSAFIAAQVATVGAIGVLGTMGGAGTIGAIGTIGVLSAMGAMGAIGAMDTQSGTISSVVLGTSSGVVVGTSSGTVSGTSPGSVSSTSLGNGWFTPGTAQYYATGEYPDKGELKLEGGFGEDRDKSWADDDSLLSVGYRKTEKIAFAGAEAYGKSDYAEGSVGVYVGYAEGYMGAGAGLFSTKEDLS